MMYKSGLKATSENMKALWVVENKDFKTTISNSASYAKWVHGEQQARAMQAIGWRKLVEVAKESQSHITTIYNRWVNKLLRDLKL